jgi:hypothetical protein
MVVQCRLPEIIIHKRLPPWHSPAGLRRFRAQPKPERKRFFFEKKGGARRAGTKRLFLHNGIVLILDDVDWSA